MPPELILPGYEKDLSTSPQDISKSANAITFLTRNGKCFWLKEFHYSLDAAYDTSIIFFNIHFSDGNDEYIAGEISRLKSENKTDKEIGESILSLQMHVGEEQIARFAFQDIMLINKGGNAIQGKQVRGAFVNDDFSNIGLAFTAYDYILNKYNLIASDNLQTPKGARLWVTSLFERFKHISIYDQDNKTFNGKITDDLLQPCGSFIWSSKESISSLQEAYDVDIVTDEAQNKINTILYSTK